MVVTAIGLNHESAPVSVRERVAFADDEVVLALGDLTGLAGVEEGVLLSTCNRTEIYCVLDSGVGVESVCRWFEGYRGFERGSLEEYLYCYEGARAAGHLMRVSSGLDSMVLGEPQILGQVKSAYRRARVAGSVRGILDRLFREAFKVSKRVRTETGIGSSPVSVASAAGGLAVQEFCQHSSRSVLLIGAGETIGLVGRHLLKKELTRVVVANRTLSHAERLAGLLGGEACGLEKVGAHLVDVDVVVASTASPRPVLYAEQVAGAMERRGGRSLVIVDLAVPRDVEPSVCEIEGVSLYTIDDLRRVTQENWRHRRGAARCAEGIIEGQVGRFMSWLGVLDAVPAIRRYRADAAACRDEVLSRARRQLSCGVAPEVVLGQMADALTNKLLHPATVSLRRAGMTGDAAMLDAARRLLGIEDTSGQNDPLPEPERKATVSNRRG